MNDIFIYFVSISLATLLSSTASQLELVWSVDVEDYFSDSLVYDDSTSLPLTDGRTAFCVAMESTNRWDAEKTIGQILEKTGVFVIDDNGNIIFSDFTQSTWDEYKNSYNYYGYYDDGYTGGDITPFGLSGGSFVVEYDLQTNPTTNIYPTYTNIVWDYTYRNDVYVPYENTYQKIELIGRIGWGNYPQKTDYLLVADFFELKKYRFLDAVDQEPVSPTNSVVNTNKYLLSDIADMRLGSQMLSVSNGKALLQFGLDMSDDLTVTWQTNAYEIEVEIPVTNDVQFFRLRMD